MDDKLIDNYLDMFLSPAWVNLSKSLESDLNVLNNLDSISSVDELYFRKGQMAILKDILALEGRLREGIE